MNARFYDKIEKKVYSYYTPVEDKNDILLVMRKGDKLALILLHFVDNQKTLQDQKNGKIDVKNLEDNYYEEFREILIQLGKVHKIIPDYLITIKTEEKLIPHEEVRFLMKKFERNCGLIPLKNNYYKIKEENI